MKGYLTYDRPGVLQPPSSLGFGWHSTGDIVFLDEDDFVHIRGRVKRFAKIAGEMVSLEVVENLATQAMPGFSHAASTRPDAAKGEAIILFTTASELTRDKLSSTAKTLGVPELAVARIIVTLKEIPALGSGKTDYVTLKKLAETSAQPAMTDLAEVS
jgi:acyl-[acyl-carrier-protein]-phospholipid O-acyltransferase/long-chain-fatty-acid--[acyl-carrier-protein] ligase